MGLKDPELAEYSDVHLINVLESRGYFVWDNDDKPDHTYGVIQDLEELYLDYMLMGNEFFDRKLRRMFNKHLNKTLMTK